MAKQRGVGIDPIPDWVPLQLMPKGITLNKLLSNH